MKRLPPLAALMLLCYPLMAQQHHGRQYLRTVPANPTALRTTMQAIDIDRRTHDTIYAYATPQQIAQLQRDGLSIELLPAPIPRGVQLYEMAPSITDMATWDKYPTHSVYRQLLQHLASSHPTLCQLDSIGQSAQGRQLYMLRITHMADTSASKPKFLYSSTMHGDETAGFILMLRLAQHLLAEYGHNDSISRLLNTTQVFICPNTNPDGTYASGDNIIGTPTRRNSNGTDLNRNFPHPTKAHPDGQQYQPETMAMMRLAQRHQFVMAANLHGGAELICFPWDYWYSHERTHPDQEWFIGVCRAYADTVHSYAPASHFTDRDNGISHSADWYPIAGSRADYMNYYHGCRELTIEVSGTKCPDASSLPQYWQWHRRALIDLMFATHTGFAGTVRNRHGAPLRAQVRIDGHDADGSSVYSDPNSGTFHRPIAPGAYSMHVEADGYMPQASSIEVAAGAPQPRIEVVLTQPQATFYVADTTGTPIAYASVRLGTAATTTLADGMATFDDVPCGTKLPYLVEADGYTSLADTLLIADTTTVMVQLQAITTTPNAVPIALAPRPKLWPNPFGHTLHINTPSAQATRVNIYNAQGRLVRSFTPQQAPATWAPAPHLPKGMYWVEVMHDGHRTIQIAVYQ